MIRVSRTALCAALAYCGVSIAATSPAYAQAPAKQAQPKYAKAEQEALFKLQEANKTKDRATIEAALAAARAAVQGAEAKSALARLHFESAEALADKQMEADAIVAMLASGGVSAENTPILLRRQFNLALERNDLPTAESAISRLMQLTPNDPDLLLSYGRLRASQKNFPEASTLLQKAIALKQGAGQTVTENEYRTALSAAYQANQLDQSGKISRDLLRAYPNADNWRRAFAVYRQVAKPDKAAQIDLYRLMRLTKAMNEQGDYLAFADTLNRTGYPGEAAAVLNEGMGNNTVKAGTPGVSDLRKAATSKVDEDRRSLPAQEKSAMASANGTDALHIGDAYFGYGDYAKAATLYQAALQKGSVDASVVNTRLGMALALSGRKAEAEAAFKAVSGARSQLADLMMIWVAQQA